MNKDECLSADWYLIGYEDGAAGRNPQQIGDYRKDCAEYSVTPDLTRYQQGHNEGSQKYCTARNGFEVGRQGQNYQGNCPANLEQTFLRGHRDGKDLHALQNAAKQAANEFEQQQRQLAQLTDLLESKKEQLIADGYTRDERAAIRQEIEDIGLQFADLAEQTEALQARMEETELNYQRRLELLKARYW